VLNDPLAITLEDDAAEGEPRFVTIGTNVFGTPERTGKGYQTLINDVLRSHLGLAEPPVTPDLVRKIVREELATRC
jgi:hypothetical protein